MSYNSCRNRHCPKCQGGARAQWLEARREELLPVEYYHVVFTLPHELSALARANRRLVYSLLMRAAAETLLEVAADPRHLGAKIGVLAVLHTWGQQLEHHPHVHCVVTGGGLSPQEDRWISCRPGFLFPVKVLSRKFRGKLLALLKAHHPQLVVPASMPPLPTAAQLARWLAPLYKKEWVVYSKRPFGSAERVLKYLARYTHGVAISNARLVKLADGQVTFRYQDYAHGNRPRTKTLCAVEFLRRFLLHVVPKGFMRIRYYGLLACGQRRRLLARCRDLLAAKSPAAAAAEASPAAQAPPPDSPESNADRLYCPRCGSSQVLRFDAAEAWTLRHRLHLDLPPTCCPFDTS